MLLMIRSVDSDGSQRFKTNYPKGTVGENNEVETDANTNKMIRPFTIDVYELSQVSGLLKCPTRN